MHGFSLFCFVDVILSIFKDSTWSVCPHASALRHRPWGNHIDGFVQDCSISSALAMEILHSCTKPAIWLPCAYNHLDVLYPLIKELFAWNITDERQFCFRWASWRLILPANWPFVLHAVQSSIKEDIKAPRYWRNPPLWGGFPSLELLIIKTIISKWIWMDGSAAIFMPSSWICL